MVSSAMACAGLQPLALAHLRWCLHGTHRGQASSGIPVEKLGWWGWRSRAAASRHGFEQLMDAQSFMPLVAGWPRWRCVARTSEKVA